MSDSHPDHSFRAWHALLGPLPPDALPERLAAFVAVGVNTLLAVPCGSDRPRVARALAVGV